MEQVHSWAREPGRGRYAHPEIERRFRVTGAVPQVGGAQLIENLYLSGLRMRLRRVSTDGQHVHKLTQKVRVVEGDPLEVAITNMYLDVEEYHRLRNLPGHVLRKTRAHVTERGTEWLIDTFEGHLLGLVLAETNCSTTTERTLPPAWATLDVTHDDRFSGGRLAAAAPDEVAALLALNGG